MILNRLESLLASLSEEENVKDRVFEKIKEAPIRHTELMLFIGPDPFSHQFQSLTKVLAELIDENKIEIDSEERYCLSTSTKGYIERLIDLFGKDESPKVEIKPQTTIDSLRDLKNKMGIRKARR